MPRYVDAISELRQGVAKLVLDALRAGATSQDVLSTVSLGIDAAAAIHGAKRDASTPKKGLDCVQ